MNDDPVETLLVDVRASTQGFAADIQTMRSSFDTTLVEGFSRAGNVLERGLLSALRRGSLGFDDLKQIALRTMDEIAAQALRGGIGALFPAGQASGAGGLAGLFNAALGAAFGLPGRATGGPVSPGRGYLVGENGPELFVPTSAGRVETGGRTAGRPRDVNVAIRLAAPRDATAPVALRRSARQVASSVKRALREF